MFNHVVFSFCSELETFARIGGLDLGYWRLFTSKYKKITGKVKIIYFHVVTARKSSTVQKMCIYLIPSHAHAISNYQRRG